MKRVKMHLRKKDLTAACEPHPMRESLQVLKDLDVILDFKVIKDLVVVTVDSDRKTEVLLHVNALSRGGDA